MKLDASCKVLLTGATSKLGICLAKELAKTNAKLFLTGRNLPILETLKKQLSTEVEIYPLDLSKKEDQENLLSIIEAEVFILVINSAGIGFYGNTLNHNLEDLTSLLEINCQALFKITYATCKALKTHSRRGVILNISSAADSFAFPDFSLYAASKTFVTNFSQGLNEEMKEFGIKVLTSAPGQIATDFRVHASKGYYQNFKGALSPEKAAKRMLQQIQKETVYDVFPFKVRIGRIVLTYLFPAFVRNALLRKNISKRCPQ